MDRACDWYNPYKVNRKFVYNGKFNQKCLIYDVKSTLCYAIYIGNMKQTSK